MSDKLTDQAIRPLTQLSRWFERRYRKRDIRETLRSLRGTHIYELAGDWQGNRVFDAPRSSLGRSDKSSKRDARHKPAKIYDSVSLRHTSGDGNVLWVRTHINPKDVVMGARLADSQLEQCVIALKNRRGS